MVDITFDIHQWSAASESFSTGGFRVARERVQTLLSNTNSSNPLTRSIHAINQHACTPNPSYLPPIPPVLSTSLPPSLYLFTQEASLTASYNIHLASNTDPFQPRKSIIHTSRWLWSLIAHDVPVSQYPRSVIRALSIEPDAFIREYHIDFVIMIARWAQVAAAIYELTAALHIRTNKQNVHNSIHLNPITFATTAVELHQLAMAFNTTVITTKTDKHSSQLSAVEYGDHEINPHLQNEWTALSKPLSSNLPDIYYAKQADIEAMRSRWLLGSLHANTPSWDTAISSFPPISAEHLPSLYVRAIVHLRRGHQGDTDYATKMLEKCVIHGYRLPDSLCLLARTQVGKNALPQWKRALSVHANRPAALWIAAQDFARALKPRQQAEILGVLRAVIEDNDLNNEDEERLRVGADNISNLEDIISIPTVDCELARALAAAGKWRDARVAFEHLPEDTLERGDVARDRAFAAAGEGDHEHAIILADAAYAAMQPGALLAKAEAYMLSGRPKDAANAVREELRNVISDKGNNADEEIGMCVLRGVCFHNLGVGHLCAEEYAAADRSFAAAQTAFAKAVDLGEDVGRLGLMSTLARCIGMWAEGESEDAAQHWVEKRGLDIKVEVMVENRSLPRPDCHVLHDVEDVVLSKMDQICLQVCRNVNAEQKLKQLVRDVEKNWSAGS